MIPFLFLVMLGVFAVVIVSVWRGQVEAEYKEESLYQTVRVERRRQVRWMRFDSRGWHGALHLGKPEKLLFPYQVAFLLFRGLLDDVRSFLAIGVGTGTALATVRRHFPQAWLFGVDIDPEVIRAAHKFFACPDDERTQYFALDGRRFVEGEGDETGALFDLVFLDAYADDHLPARLATVEFVQALKDRLTERGVVCVNLIGSLKGRECTDVMRAWSTYREVFRHVMLVPTTPFSRESQNVLLFATDAPLPTREELRQAVERMEEMPRHKRRLRRMVQRLVFMPECPMDKKVPLTDEDVRLLRY
ncbi:MAG TPA: fused MFS/spermidine synthase [Bacilli bacterium]|nr:fused MFS/spermidine synthase [Bacilli bacterium]